MFQKIAYHRIDKVCIVRLHYSYYHFIRSLNSVTILICNIFTICFVLYTKQLLANDYTKYKNQKFTRQIIQLVEENKFNKVKKLIADNANENYEDLVNWLRFSSKNIDNELIEEIVKKYQTWPNINNIIIHIEDTMSWKYSENKIARRHGLYPDHYAINDGGYEDQMAAIAPNSTNEGSAIGVSVRPCIRNQQYRKVGKNHFWRRQRHERIQFAGSSACLKRSGGDGNNYEKVLQIIQEYNDQQTVRLEHHVPVVTQKIVFKLLSTHLRLPAQDGPTRRVPSQFLAPP